MKYQPFAILLIALVLGILLHDFFNISIWVYYLGLAFTALILIISRFYRPFNFLFGIVAVLIFVFLGSLRMEQKNEWLQNEIMLEQSAELIRFRVNKTLKPSEKYNKYIAEIQEIYTGIDSKFPHETILVYVRKNQEKLHVNDGFTGMGRLSFINKVSNPYQFDYKTYMNRKGVDVQVFLDSIVQIEHPKGFNIEHIFSKFKEDTKNQLEEKEFSKAARVFISSLALGDRSDLDREWQKKLSAAGVMHLFAISGLHVGIIFGFLLIILYPLLFLKNGRIIRIVSSLIFIWLYAWFVGFTPSVSRAAFMISMYYATFLLSRPANGYHALAFTALVILIINPNQLYDVGFQLSYSAVFYIFWLYTLVRSKLPKYRKRWKNYLYDTVSITISAQFGVIAISLYYFNQFSALFLIGNLVLLPFAAVMIILSLLTVFLLSSGLYFPFVKKSMNFLFDLIFKFIELLSGFDKLIFRDISISIFQAFLLIILLILVRYYLEKFKWHKLLPILAVLFIFQLTRVYDNFYYNQKEELIVFNQYRGSILGIRKAEKLDVFWQVEDSAKSYDFTIYPYVLNEKIKEVSFHNLLLDKQSGYYVKQNNLIKFNQKTIAIINKKMDTIPSVNYAILINGQHKSSVYVHDKTKNIILDGSNYQSVVNRLQKIGDKVISTSEKGAILIKAD